MEKLTAAVLELWKERGEPFTLDLEGRSMVPLAHSGDRVTIRPLPPDDLRCGDIIALQQNGVLVVHRLLMVRRSPDGSSRYCQKGDNSPNSSWVDPGSLVGRVEAIEGPGRHTRLTQSPWTWINPLTGWLGRAGLLSHRLGRCLSVPLIRFGLKKKPRPVRTAAL